MTTKAGEVVVDESIEQQNRIEAEKQAMEKDQENFVKKEVPVFDNGKMVGTTTVVERMDVVTAKENKLEKIQEAKVNLQYKLITEWLTPEESEVLKML